MPLKRIFNLISAILLLQVTCSQAQTDVFSLPRRYNHLDSGLHYAMSVVRRGIAEHAPAVICRGYLLRGRLFNEKGNYTKAAEMLDSALHLSRDHHLLSENGLAYCELGRTEQLSKHPIQALSCYLRAMDIFNKIDDDINRARVNILMAEYYRSLARFEDARFHINHAFAISQRHKLPIDLEILLYNRSAAIMTETGKHDSSLVYSRHALELSRKIGDLNSEAISLNEVAYLLEPSYPRQLSPAYYNRARKIWKDLGYMRSWCHATLNYARCFSRDKNFTESNRLLKMLVDTLKDKPWKNALIPVYYQLSNNYRDMNQHVLADRYYILFLEEDVRQFKSEHAKELEELKTRYQTEQKENEIKRKQQLLDIVNLNYETEKRQKTTAWLMAILLLAFLTVITLLLAQRSRSNLMLSRKNDEIEKMNKELQRALDRSEILMREVHHRVKNTMQIMSSMFNLQVDMEKDPNVRSILEENDHRVMMMAYLHEKLYARHDMELIKVRDFLVDVTNNIFMTVSGTKDNIRYGAEIGDVKVKIDQAVIIGIIINELVTNSVKYAFAPDQQEKNVFVEVKMRDNSVFLKISDNGKGMPEGFNISESESFGMRLVEIMVRHSGGTVRVINQQGTTIEINL